MACEATTLSTWLSTPDSGKGSSNQRESTMLISSSEASCSGRSRSQGLTKVNHKAAIASIGKLWKALPEEQKKPFVAQMVADKEKRVEQLKEFLLTGQFTDRTVSTPEDSQDSPNHELKDMANQVIGTCSVRIQN